MVTILWSAGAGIAITLAAVCALLWQFERRNLSMLMLCVFGVATAACAYIELGMFNAATPAEFGEWQQWYHVPLFFAFLATMLFVRYYLGTGRAWLLWTVFAVRSVVLVLNFSVYPNFHFYRIDSLRQMPLFGEQVSIIGVAATREWQWFALATMILVIAYLIDAAARAWLQGDAGLRRKALVVILAIALPLLGTIVYAHLVVFGIIQVPVSNGPWFLGALLVMVSELVRDFVVSTRAKLELAELQHKLAQVERGNVVGQFASSLADELSRPSNGTSSNIVVARRKAECPESDMQELRATLDEVDNDGLRGVKLIHRMRGLFERRSVETKPVAVEEVVQDVVALVRAEAKSKGVDVGMRIQPWLPPVFADRVHLSQVLLNLLANSIHAVQSRPIDARKIVVDARAVEGKDEVEIAVRDSGPGVPSDLVEKIFEPFFSTKEEGMGIGLALSRTIVEAQGGRLWLDNVAGQEGGAVFRLVLRPV